jgi:hypothetical protein
MSVLVLQELFDRKLHEASEMSNRELISELKGSITGIRAMPRDNMIEIVAMKLSNKELEAMK